MIAGIFAPISIAETLYIDGVSGSVNDCNIYILEGDETGGTVLVLGGSHPEEPAGRLATWIMVENAHMKKAGKA